MNELDKMLSEIKRHDELYWQKHEPEISDSEYDELVELYRRFRPNDPYFDAVQHDVIIKKKVKHPRPMLSLDKVYTFWELLKSSNRGKTDSINFFKLAFEFGYKFCGVNSINTLSRNISRFSSAVFL
jgi:NAD-dependent DNA ligase